ncbi:MAG: hypothetical protein KGZ39_00210 [Simkania sp.]|nr:hypothetical protein [Simkania sp.]
MGKIKKWIKVSDETLPPQGLKVLCFRKGDCWVAQRFNKYWIPMPYTDSKYANANPPEFFKYIDFPGEYTGEMKVLSQIDKKILSMDEYEKENPKGFKELYMSLIKNFE